MKKEEKDSYIKDIKRRKRKETLILVEYSMLFFRYLYVSMYYFM